MKLEISSMMMMNDDDDAILASLAMSIRIER